MFDTLASLKKGDITVEQAKAMSEIGQTIINSAKAEIEFVKATGVAGSGFIPDGSTRPALTNNAQAGLPAGVMGVRVHRIAG